MKRVLLTSLFVLAASSAFAQQTTPPARPATTPPSRPSTQPPPGVSAPITPTPGAAPSAQTPAPRAMTPEQRDAAAAREAGIWQNIKLDLVLTDNYTGTPVKKTVTMIMSSGRSGQIRTTNQVGGFDVELNVDAQASTKVNPPGFSGPIQIYTSITVQYMPAPTPDTSSRGPSKPSGLHQSISFALLDGKPMLISQSADPVTDRKVTLEVTATVLK
ncbi:MAG TPA: hypothetical protein VFV98_03550 [Vicinamibacterales bacterium]|nr:hypothetical protein [Vicinamibacterales bacterium]